MTTTLVFYGDSRAADWPPPDFLEFTFINRGVGGQTSAEALAYVDHTFAELKPQIIILMKKMNMQKLKH